MPLCPKSLDNRIRDWLSTFLALCAITMCMAIDTPSITVLLHEWSARVKRITALRAEEVSRMPLSTTCHNDLTFNGCLARLAAGREHLVEVEMTEETLRLISAIFMFQACHVVWGGMRREEGNVFTPLASLDARDTFCELVVWLGIESNTFKVLSTLVADKTLGMEAIAGCRNNATCNG
jgi:hypothetical protein